MLRLAARMILVAGALWAQHGASEALAEQLADPPPASVTFPDAVRETLAYLLLGATS